MNEELENLNKEYQESVEYINPNFEDAELLSILKKYVDDRFDLLDRKVTMLRDHIFDYESDSND